MLISDNMGQNAGVIGFPPLWIRSSTCWSCRCEVYLEHNHSERDYSDIVGRSGVEGVRNLPLIEAELAAFQSSSRTLKDRQVEIG